MIKEELQKQIAQTLDIDAGRITLEHPEDFKHGDFACNIALVLAKEAKKNPAELAASFAAKLAAAHIPHIEKIEVAGPGFINFYLTRDFFTESIDDILKQKELFGHNDALKGKKVMVEYTDPNPFKEFHIGHLMTNTIGESLARLFVADGAETKKVCYQGDKGLHVAKALWGKMQKSDASWGESYVLGSQGFEAHKEEITVLNKKIYIRSDETINKLYDEGRRFCLQVFEELYKKLGTKFDHYFFESETAPIGEKIVRDNLPKGVFEVGENGAIIYPGEKHGLHTRVFINAEGIPTYEAKELGLAFAKRDAVPVRENAWSQAKEHIAFPFEKTISVTGNEINDYFKVILSALSQVDNELAEKVKHISHGMLRLPSGKMSSRTGDVITAESLIEEVKVKVLERMKDRQMKDKQKIAEQIAIGAIKFSILKQAPGKDIIFDFDTSISFEGDSGPYLQYTAVRANSVLKKVGKNSENFLQKIFGAFGSSSYKMPREVADLERMLYRLPEIVHHARVEYAPQYVVTYLLSLAAAFNAFYGNTKIIGSDFENYYCRLTDATRTVLTNGLSVLGISVPEEM